MSSKDKYTHFSFSRPIESDFHLWKADSLNKVFYAWVKIVSQQTNQDECLENSYQTHFVDEVLCPNSTEKIEEKLFQSNPLFNQEGQSSHSIKPLVNKNFHQWETVCRKNKKDLLFFLFLNHKIYIKGDGLGLSYVS